MDKNEKALQKAATKINSGNESQKSEKQKLLDGWMAFVNGHKLGFKASDGSVYLKVEAWNYLFAQQGLIPTITDISRYVQEDGVLYIAKAALIKNDQTSSEEGIPMYSSAFGACKVDDKTFYKEEFSALSMAQTRAIGKLGRTVFAHLAEACGYKACPFEEMDFGDKK